MYHCDSTTCRHQIYKLSSMPLHGSGVRYEDTHTTCFAMWRRDLRPSSLTLLKTYASFSQGNAMAHLLARTYLLHHCTRHCHDRCFNGSNVITPPSGSYVKVLPGQMTTKVELSVVVTLERTNRSTEGHGIKVMRMLRATLNS